MPALLDVKERLANNKDLKRVAKGILVGNRGKIADDRVAEETPVITWRPALDPHSLAVAVQAEEGRGENLALYDSARHSPAAPTT